MVVNEKVLEKVKKILALASNNPSEEEAQAAMLMAQRIMAENGITLAEVEGFTNEVVDVPITQPHRTRWWYKILATIIADNFRCEAYFNTINRMSRLMLIGLKQDTEVATKVFNYAVDAVRYHTAKYVEKIKRDSVNNKPLDLTGIRNDYILGFLDGLKDKFKEQVEKNNWGLILVKDNSVLKAVEKKGLQPGRKPVINFARSNNAYASGYRTGKEFETRERLTECI
ncbi:DUF2786 domain-containing protein [Moorella sp. Hama-1]|uniref:DUF2786 domain-containing protein n=1 Tax=Moorella sp. Hama-1 TaxID=2138101 RepID=UPI000D65AFFD|nr:DUF2786 domain-containing protein [Moorella sp. Hama-1]BCV20352.1 hypothetical protein hamaS1_04210 [Moorella sp. Hama-1]